MTTPPESRNASRPAPPSAPELPLPSLSSLVNATGIALVIACVLLVFVVFPAEYNIDPTGFGKAIGLTRLSAPEVEDTSDGDALNPNDGNAGSAREDRVVIEIPAGRGLEYKFALKAGEKMVYNWTIDEGDNASGPDSENIIYDFHGEPTGGEKGFFESYSVSYARGAKGTFTAPFDGVHGWYWNNNTGTSPVRIILTTSGSYEVLGLR